MERWVRRMWTGQAGPAGRVVRVLLWPLAAVYRGGMALRGTGFRGGVLAQQGPAIPVVSVGNLTVGGTGKTPVSGWIVSELLQAELGVALVARGYGRDEMLLHKRWNPAAEVIANPDRVAGVWEAASRGCDVAVLDDAFQHRRIRRSLDVVLLAAETEFPGPTLPRGPYREPATALRRADLVVVTRKAAGRPASDRIAAAVRETGFKGPVVQLHLEPARFEDVDGRGSEQPAGPVAVFTAVADPDSVCRGLEGMGIAVAEVEIYPDHHEFNGDDLVRLRQLALQGTVVVTEKDAVKIARLLQDRPTGEVHPPMDLRVVCLELRFESGEDDMRESITHLISEAGTP